MYIGGFSVKNKLDSLFFALEFVPKRHKFKSQSRIGDSARVPRDKSLRNGGIL